MKNTNIRIVGVGGQGIILASNLISDVALRAGFDVKKAEVHGMSQRGGSVTSDVRFGQKVYSPLIAPGEVDILVAFERLEALRALPALADGGSVVLNLQSIAPSSLLVTKAEYPVDAEDRLRAAVSRVIAVDGPLIAADLGDSRVINSVVLGALSTMLPFEMDQWEEAYRARLKNKGVDVNLKAFVRGREQGATAEVTTGVP